MLFNSKVASFRPVAVLASKENIAAAFDFVKKSFLSGGTDLKQALQTAFDQFQPPAGFTGRAVLISDGNPTLGTTETRRLAQWFTAANATASGPKFKLYARQPGNDCNKILSCSGLQSRGWLFEF
jgi:Ca-activated chloride channel family protein